MWQMYWLESTKSEDKKDEIVSLRVWNECGNAGRSMQNTRRSSKFTIPSILHTTPPFPCLVAQQLKPTKVSI